MSDQTLPMACHPSGYGFSIDMPVSKEHKVSILMMSHTGNKLTKPDSELNWSETEQLSRQSSEEKEKR